MDDAEIGRMISGKADAESYKHGMLIRFDSDASKLTGSDMLLIATPSGAPLSLVPVSVDGDALVVSAHIGPAAFFHFKLVPVDATTRRLEMEPHHIELLAGR